ncbi:transcription repressor NadR [Amphibacillus xylanus]|uniref:Putative regulatory protein n=1 Tax=Amphibacillus xylanus (strain ATCC 51415 / DSM 6626 / JCM 7361 / LMG 17667 / NBRC 15112 / Ep01) TaxID=698758 RepID=K0J227_AMPXN|nr:transcription repressor NadR [Amphibacillus xylanus]BAM47162.1 putative regulatory protein [Amphibacillus xylanus NBRC 15112]
MSKKEKLIGKERREAIIEWLSNSEEPLTGSELAERAGVSRQVIVQDISLLKAKNTTIISTSRGYLLLKDINDIEKYERVVVVKHRPEQTKEELDCIVDQGVTVKDVIVEHPFYGELRAQVMVSDRHDVKQFIKDIHDKNASYLSELTDGIHLHTLEAESEAKLDAAYQALKQKGFIVKE